MSLLKKAASKGPRLRCSKCQVFFKTEDLGPDEDAVCSGCHAKYRLKVFPAFARKPVTLSDQDVLPLDDAHCYHAEDRRAVTKCDDCGRGVSEFMKVSLGANRVTCLTCLHEHREDGDELLLATRRTATDNRAFLLAALPLIVLPVTLISAFIALFFIVKDWRSGERSPMSPGGWKFKVALGLVVMQLGFWAWVMTTANVQIPMAALAQPAEQPSMDEAMQKELEAAFEQAFREAAQESF